MTKKTQATLRIYEKRVKLHIFGTCYRKARWQSAKGFFIFYTFYIFYIFYIDSRRTEGVCPPSDRALSSPRQGTQ